MHNHTHAKLAHSCQDPLHLVGLAAAESISLLFTEPYFCHYCTAGVRFKACENPKPAHATLPTSQLSVHQLGQLVRSPLPLPTSKVLSGSALALSGAFIFQAQGRVPLKSMDPFQNPDPFCPSASWATVFSQLPLSCRRMDDGLSLSFISLPHPWDTG